VHTDQRYCLDQWAVQGWQVARSKDFLSEFETKITPWGVEADNGYQGEPYHARTADRFVSRADDRAKQSVRAKHKTVTQQLKEWSCLIQVWWRHDRRLHKTVFAAVAVITQLAFEIGEPPYQCRY
jgi:hypothetical protein